MRKEIASNRELWDTFTPIHADSKFYDLDSFLKGRCTLKSIERELLGDTSGKTMLHLQCHFGLDSLSWARCGTKVTGVDISPKAIELANELNTKLDLDAEFICSDVYSLGEKTREKFDIVFTSYGVLCWLDDLNVWAKTIATHLKKDGQFLIVEQHPLADIFEQQKEVDDIEIKYSYFEKKMLELEVDGSYASEKVKIDKRISYEWIHPLTDIFEALISNGLTISHFREYPFSMYQKFPCMNETEEGWWIVPDKPDLPLLFSLSAQLK